MLIFGPLSVKFKADTSNLIVERNYVFPAKVDF